MSEKIIVDVKNLTTKGLETREKLLCAAEKVFGSKGYYEASIVNITQEANVAHGTFYNYFPTKKDIFDELIRKFNRELRLIIKEEMKGDLVMRRHKEEVFKHFFDG